MFLTDDMVPGAKLKFSNAKNNNVATLKRWLSCHNLKISREKNELIHRSVSTGYIYFIIFSSSNNRRSK